jgi:hypothetical protein
MCEKKMRRPFRVVTSGFGIEPASKASAKNANGLRYHCRNEPSALA